MGRIERQVADDGAEPEGRFCDADGADAGRWFSDRTLGILRRDARAGETAYAVYDVDGLRRPGSPACLYGADDLAEALSHASGFYPGDRGGIVVGVDDDGTFRIEDAPAVGPAELADVALGAGGDGLRLAIAVMCFQEEQGKVPRVPASAWREFGGRLLGSLRMRPDARSPREMSEDAARRKSEWKRERERSALSAREIGDLLGRSDNVVSQYSSPSGAVPPAGAVEALREHNLRAALAVIRERFGADAVSALGRAA